MIKIRDYKPTSPEWVMANFFNCWKRRAWVQLLDYVKLSWLNQYNEPNRVLRLSLHTLVDTEFVQVNANTGVVAVFLMDIHTKSRAGADKSRRAVMLVHEDGRWGIDPKSIT